MSKKKRQPTLGESLRKLREEKEITLTIAAASIRTDIAILSKIERDERKLNKELLLKLLKLYREDTKQWLIRFVTEKVLYEIRDEEYGHEALKIAEKEIKYRKPKRK